MTERERAMLVEETTTAWRAHAPDGRVLEHPAWADLPQQVNRTRSGDYFVAVRPSEGIERAPSNVGAKAAQ